VTIEMVGGTVNLSWESGKASFSPGKVEAFPEHSAFELSAKGVVNGDKFVKALMTLLPCCSTDDSKQILKGVTVHLGDTTELWAADGFRLATITIEDAFPAKETIVIPADTVRVLGYLWSKLPATPPLAGTLVQQIISKRELRLGLAAGKMVARFGRLTVVSPLVAGTPPDHKRVVPTELPLKVRVLAREFETGLQLLKKSAKEASGIVRMEWDESQLTLSVKSEKGGDISAIIPVQTEGGPGKTAANVKYLMEYFKGKDGLVTMSVNTPSAPITFKSSGAPLVIVMPMFVDWDGSQAAKAKADQEAAAAADAAEEAAQEAADNAAPDTGKEEPGDPEEGATEETVATTAAED
jgi:DNA polymerase III sliding clamp (beta) subunit (PCNA family)